MPSMYLIWLLKSCIRTKIRATQVMGLKSALSKKSKSLLAKNNMKN